MGSSSTGEREGRGQATSTPGLLLHLPRPLVHGSVSLEGAIARRRSVREFAHEPLTSTQLSQLLWAAQGVTGPGGARAAPSAGALYPLELHVVRLGSVCRYLPEQHALAVRAAHDLRPALAAAALDQSAVAAAAAVIVVSAVYGRSAARYGARAERYAVLEAGHAAQDILLEATALGLAAVPIGAFDDDAVKRVLALPHDHEPLYLLALGRPAGGREQGVA